MPTQLIRHKLLCCKQDIIYRDSRGIEERNERYMKTILVFFGGHSGEYGVSLQSASAVLRHMDRTHWRVLTVGITQQGQWLYYTGDIEDIETDVWHTRTQACVPCTLLPSRAAHALLLMDGAQTQVPFDAAFPILHGKNGEDGTLQGMLELAGIPVIGCGTLASALCMDKERSHALAAAHGIAVPRGRTFGRGTPVSIVYEAARQIGYPLFVKPLRGGSSLGISRVTAQTALEQAIDTALQQDDAYLLEEAVSGFEVGCAVLGNETLTIGQIDQIVLAGGFFDFTQKYTLETARILCPAQISPEATRRIKNAAEIVYRALNCRVFARVDFFLTPQGRVIFNEVNTIPGFTAHSRYPNMMRQAGIDFEELIDRIVTLGTEA